MSEEVVLKLDVQRQMPVDYVSPIAKYLSIAEQASRKYWDEEYRKVLDYVRKSFNY